jgi:hypothetical protein
VTTCVTFSVFRLNFPKSIGAGFVKDCYRNHILAVAAKDPAYRWSSPYEVRIAATEPYASRQFAQGAGPIIKKAVIRFGEIVNWQEVLGW